MKRSILAVALAAIATRATLFVVQVLFGFRQILVGPFYFVPWADYYGIYVAQLGLLAKGILPYVGFGYSYPPLFLYSMLPLYEAGGELLPAIWILAADVFTAVVICLIVAERSNVSHGMLAGLAYALLPLALANEGYLWLSTQPMLFFAILSLYFFGHKRTPLSMVALGIALMFKQEVILIAIPLLYLAFRDDFWVGLKGLGSLLGTVGLVSLPFLLTMPTYYLTEVTFGLVKLVQPSAQQILNPWGGLTFYGGAKACPGLCIVIDTNQIRWDQFMTQLDHVLGWVTPFLIVLSVVGLYAVRRGPGALYAALAAAVIVFLYGFSLVVHLIYPYYALPVYALLICSSTNRGGLASSVIGGSLATFVSFGAIQLVVSLVTLLLCVAFVDKAQSAPRSTLCVDSSNTLETVEGGDANSVVSCKPKLRNRGTSSSACLSTKEIFEPRETWGTSN